jgi:hypothetical protein
MKNPTKKDLAVAGALSSVRSKLRAEYRRVEDAFDKHIKKNNCYTDSGGCEIRYRYQERLATLRFALSVAGAREKEEGGWSFTTIED